MTVTYCEIVISRTIHIHICDENMLYNTRHGLLKTQRPQTRRWKRPATKRSRRQRPRRDNLFYFGFVEEGGVWIPSWNSPFIWKYHWLGGSTTSLRYVLKWHFSRFYIYSNGTPTWIHQLNNLFSCLGVVCSTMASWGNGIHKRQTCSPYCFEIVL